jgi:hypothetical protein
MGHAARAESSHNPGPRAFAFDLSITGLRGGHQGAQQSPGNRGDLVYSVVESMLVDLRGLLESRKFPHELQRGTANLNVGRRWLEIEKGLDASAHGF